MMPSMGIPDYAKSTSPYSNIKMNKSEGNIPQEFLDKINPAPSRNLNAPKGPKKRQGELDKNDFLKMLSFQIQHQDPMKPMDQSKLTADLAQFSQLEQLANINSQLAKDENKAQLEEKFYAASFLGKSVLTTGEKIKHDANNISGSKIYFQLGDNAKNIRVRIFDAKNNLVAQEELENLPAGANEYTWKGNTLDNQLSSTGEYTFKISAWDDKFQEIEVKTKSKGIVSGVSLDNGQIVLNVDGKKVHLYDVLSFELNQGQISNQ